MNVYVCVVNMIAVNYCRGGEDNRFTNSTSAAYRDTHKHKDCYSVVILTVRSSHNCWKATNASPITLAAINGSVRY